MIEALQEGGILRVFLKRCLPESAGLAEFASVKCDPSQQVELTCAAWEFAVWTEDGFGFGEALRLGKLGGSRQPDLLEAAIELVPGERG